MTDTNTDDDTAELRAHQWINTMAIGIVLVAVISMMPGETTVLQLVILGAGLLLVLGAAFSVVDELTPADEAEEDDPAEEAAP